MKGELRTCHKYPPPNPQRNKNNKNRRYPTRQGKSSQWNKMKAKLSVINFRVRTQSFCNKSFHPSINFIRRVLSVLNFSYICIPFALKVICIISHHLSLSGIHK